ncbi:MAG: SIS domain-containing protein [Actinomycetota bacterium]|nr:SIS domain-containing protein [Actinomycetota bacterium]
MSGGSFLYPFLDAEETDAAALGRDLAGSAEAKAAESIELRRTSIAGLGPDLDRVAAAMAAAFAAGGRLFTFGNGGSATDAAGLAALFASPSAGRPLPARSLVADPAVLTALANDVGVEVVFSRQLIAHARAGDIAVGLSTSGGSVNVLQAFAEGRRRGLLTVGLAGYRGGAMATCPDLDHCLAVEGQSVHRTQEAQSALAHALWRRVQQHLEQGESR